MNSISNAVLITGARGFVGGPTVAAFRAADWRVLAAVRSGWVTVVPSFSDAHSQSAAECRRSVDDSLGFQNRDCDVKTFAIGEIGPETEWGEALRGVEVVVHLAARVHQMNDVAADPLAEFRRVNVAGTRRLAEQAAAAGVRRLVFVSSIKVNGEGTEPGAVFRAGDAPAPQDAYGMSKAEAEAALFEVARATGLEVVVVRPPLMVGRGVKGNLAALAGAIRRGRPLPLGAIRENRRCLLDVRNLAELLVRCAEHPAAAGRVFLASDGVPVSTAELAWQVGRAVGRDPRLFSVPVSVLRLAGRLLGKQAVVERLTGSLLIDDSETRRVLGWKPRFGPGDWEV